MRSAALLKRWAWVSVCVATAFFAVNSAFAEDAATLYKQLCATCHDTGLERARVEMLFAECLRSECWLRWRAGR